MTSTVWRLAIELRTEVSRGMCRYLYNITHSSKQHYHDDDVEVEEKEAKAKEMRSNGSINRPQP